MKSSKVSIKTRSTPASLSFKGQATKHTTVKWSIEETGSCLANSPFLTVKLVTITIICVTLPITVTMFSTV